MNLFSHTKERRHEGAKAVFIQCAFVFLFCVFPATGVFAAPTPPWTVADAPFRFMIKLLKAPELPEAGVEINVPEFGQTRADMSDLLLTDRDGTPQPLARIGRRTGGRILLLAQKLEPDMPYFLYFGGDKQRAIPDWTPKVSLLMETRPAPSILNFDSLQSLKNAWALSPEPPGAGFVSMIYQGGNPFGPNMNFLTHYTGYLRLPKAREITFYTLSSDCSFVVINDQEQFGWPGRHSPSTSPDKVAKKTIQCPEGLTKIDYYAAKGEILPEERLEAATVFGWQKETGFEAIPREAWIHPGSSQLGGIQSADNRAVPLINAHVDSFVGYAGQWYYETKFEVRQSPQPIQWEATWTFEDGATGYGVFRFSAAHRARGADAPMHAHARGRHTDGAIPHRCSRQTPAGFRQRSHRRAALPGADPGGGCLQIDARGGSLALAAAVRVWFGSKRRQIRDKLDGAKPERCALADGAAGCNSIPRAERSSAGATGVYESAAISGASDAENLRDGTFDGGNGFAGVLPARCGFLWAARADFVAEFWQ